MQRPEIHPLSIHWLVDRELPATEDSSDGGIEHFTYPIASEVGSGWFERLPLAADMSVFYAEHRFCTASAGRLLPLGEFSTRFDMATLTIQTVQGGTLCNREFEPPMELIFKPGFDFFRRADGLHVIPLADTSSNSEMTTLVVSDQKLVELLGDDVALLMIEQLGLMQVPTVKVLPMPLHVSAPLRGSVSPSLQGSMKLLYAQSKALEYLCGLVAHLQGQQQAPVMPERRRNRIQELHAALVSLDGKLPSLDELSRQFGMSARWLNDEFAKEYGLPIYAFIADHRLKAAHAALLESAVPIKDLSITLGYSHVNHFTNAFKRKFGYPPGSLRHNTAGVAGN